VTIGKFTALVGVGLPLLLCCGSLALAEETTLTEYKEAVEPICRTNAEASKQILGGVRDDVKAERLARAAAKFKRAATVLQRTRRQLAAVPKPASEATRLSKWLELVQAEVVLLRKVAKALREDQPNRARRYVVILTSNANQANSQILPLDLRACRFQPAEYA
jgi:hypothetical protein